ncbi:MAG: hypothetical protein GX351_12025 [Peptococcaceae bacterium]|uniref:hypothetical protein n=1 Tax=Acetivibrio saccincola TaxID=1677857 RepID=UPI0017CC6514|nr:hypothetical protein [Acetivibrio saccincola]NLP45337.1 hypothetical protein [Peptococcaceae bacterium]HOA98304.1 hypothetical protein [Acetivibrio saccincola]HQD29059.1 hypothetical protein [Acetivibrio saccincola]
MSDNLSDFIFNISMVVIFTVAVSVFFALNLTSKSVVDHIERTVNRDSEVMEVIDYNR